MITFRKARRESELSLMSRGEDRRGSAISVTAVRRQSLDGNLFLGVPPASRGASASFSQDDAIVLPAITKTRSDSGRWEEEEEEERPAAVVGGGVENHNTTTTAKDPDSSSIHSAEITIDLRSLKSQQQDGAARPGAGDDGGEGRPGEGRKVSTQSMQFGEDVADFKVNNRPMVKRIWMNILVMSVAFMLLFSSISALASLQSTIHEGNLGVVGLAVNFSTVVVSCLFVPNLLIKYIGYKWAVTLSMLGGVGWMVCNIFARWETVIPGSILLGLSWAPLWTAHSAYVTSLAKKYAILTAVPKEEAITKFFGVFYTMFLTAPVWGNLVAAGVLGGFGGGDDGSMGNSTDPNDDEVLRELLKFCGANYCPLQDIPENATAVQVERPTFEQIATLIGINVGITSVGFIITALFVDRETSPKLQLPPEVKALEETEEAKSITELLLTTIKQTLRKKQLLMMPFTIYVGLEQAFIMAEFTSAFIACTVGLEFVSLCVICYGVVGGICAVIMGKLVLKTGRIPIFITGVVIHLALMITMFFWDLDPSHAALLLIVPGLWGIGDSIFQSQINAFYGNVFCDNSEAAFANYRMWESVGFILGYGYSGLLCVYVKLYVLLVLLILSVTGYLVVEIWLNQKRKRAATEAAIAELAAGKSKMAEQAPGDGVGTGSPIGNDTLGSTSVQKEATGSSSKTAETTMTASERKPVKKTSASSAPTLETMMESDA